MNNHTTTVKYSHTCKTCGKVFETHRRHQQYCNRACTYPPLEDRFWNFVNKTDTCWLWTGYVASHGYGVINSQGKLHYAHRLAYQYVVGPILPGFELDHLCRVRHCVNPSHLQPVSHYENIMRGEAFSAQKARQTHCKHGHPLSGDNLIINKQNERRCRICSKRLAREADLRRQERRRQAKIKK